MQVAECVALENEIRLLTASLKEKRAYLRQCLKAGMQLEDGPLASFASDIATGKFLGGAFQGLRPLSPIKRRSK